MKKKITALVLVVAVLAMLFTGMTLAYFTDTDDAVNVFVVGEIDIELTEEVGVKDALGKEHPEKVVKGENYAVYSNILAGNVLTKAPTVSNVGTAPAYVRVTVIMNNYNFINAMIEYYEGKGYNDEQIQQVVDDVFNGWCMNYDHYPNSDQVKDMRMAIPEGACVDIDDNLLKVDSTFTTTQGSFHFGLANWFKTEHEEERAAAGKYDAGQGPGFDGGYYAHVMNNYELCQTYYLYMEPGDEATLFQGLTCPTYFDQEQAKMFKDLKIEIHADAIQAEGFADEMAAFEALEDAHPLSTIRGRVSDPVIVEAGSAAELETALNNAPAGSIVKLTADVDSVVTITGDLDGVYIDGQGHSTSGIKVDASASLEDVTIANLKSGSGEAITIPAGATVDNLTVINCEFSNAGGRTIFVSESTAKVTILDSSFVNTKYAVYGFTPCTSLTVSGCSFENVGSWTVLLNGGAAVPAELTITGNTFTNCTGGIAKYLGDSVPEGGFMVFTDNVLTSCKGHDGSDAKWFTLPYAVADITVSGNTLDGADWTPGTAQGLGK